MKIFVTQKNQETDRNLQFHDEGVLKEQQIYNILTYAVYNNCTI